MFVHPESLRATGVPNFLHVRRDGLAWLDDERHRQWIAGSPTIRRRSGVEKFEIDLRKGPARLAGPLELAGIVFAAPASAASSVAKLHPVDSHDVPARLAAEQAYAASQPAWADFARTSTRLSAFELVRGQHPSESIRLLRQLL